MEPGTAKPLMAEEPAVLADATTIGTLPATPAAGGGSAGGDSAGGGSAGDAGIRKPVEVPGASAAAPGEDDAAIAKFVEYLRIKTTEPAPEYSKAASFLEVYASELGLPCKRIEPSAGHPIVLITWEGTNPDLPSVVLNSHIDVVPAPEDRWTVDPWAGKIEAGKIYGRGTQDMKSVGIQYLEAIRRLRRVGYTPSRTVHVLFVPDEEIGGVKGMKALLDSDLVKTINIGVVMDEGLASPTSTYSVFYGERKPWWVVVKAEGPAGHGSRFIVDTAVEKLVRVSSKMFEYREKQRLELERTCACGKQLGDFISLNLTGLQAGVPGGEFPWTFNVVPKEAYAAFDCRIPASEDLDEFKAKLDEWTEEDGVSWELRSGTEINAMSNPTTPITDDNEWWCAFKRGCNGAGIEVSPAIFPAATDSRYLRALGYPALGFSPMNNTPILLHDDDEHVPVSVFLEGIAVYTHIIPNLAEL